MSSKLKQIPNILSVIRILLVFVFVYFALMPDPVGLKIAIIVFLVAGATDVVDGFLARRFNWVTEIGKILDPFADKLMQCTVLVVLCAKHIVPLWFIIPCILKELFTLMAGLLVIRKRSVVVVSRWYGKAAVCVFYATIVASVVFEEALSHAPVVHALMFLPAIGFAIGALVGYVKHYYSLKNPTSGLSQTKEL